jgi:hypothetical protein
VPALRRACILGWALVSLGPVACNALTGAGDLGIDPCADDACAPASPATDAREETVVTRDAGEPDDARDAATEAAARPTFCAGLSLYLPFDGNTTAAQGDVPAQAVTAKFGAGLFGQALDFESDASLFYTAAPKGKAVRYLADEGTVLFWFRPRWAFPGTADRTFVRPKQVFASTGAGGPELSLTVSVAPQLLAFDVPNTASAGAPAAAITPAWKELGWNHLAGTWTRTATPTLTFTLNGASNGMAAARQETTTPWTPPDPVVYVRFGSATNPIDGLMDDVGIWTRVLSLAEIQAIHAAALEGRSIASACGL